MRASGFTWDSSFASRSSCAASPRTTTGTSLPGEILDSTRRFRTATTMPWRNSTSRSDAASNQDFFARGHAAVASVSPSCGSACHSSSVT